MNAESIDTLNRTVIIRATPDIVFRFFTDSARWASWWGAGSFIDARPGGRLSIRYPGGVEAAGEVVSIEIPRQIVFTYGYVSGKPIPVGGSRVTIDVEPHADGTRLSLSHALADPAVRQDHVQGWRYQLSLFANLVSAEQLAGAAGVADDWFAAWSIEETDARRTALSAIASSSVQFRDRFSAIDGLDELVPHIGASQRFMPGVSMKRHGDVRQCQGIVLAEWTATSSDGQPRGAGTNVFQFGPDGKVVSVTGFWQ
ncbi:MAG TPA: SRPBCC domain-containing protein [Vicinamibacterales bacterium]|jgi:uncharacterized protein YndB with AHSA1/START domain